MRPSFGERLWRYSPAEGEPGGVAERREREEKEDWAFNGAGNKNAKNTWQESSALLTFLVHLVFYNFLETPKQKKSSREWVRLQSLH